MRPPAGLNEIIVHEQPLLLCVTPGGTAVHLTATTDDAGRAAVPVHWIDPVRRGYTPSVAGYDPQRLTAPVWKPNTLCGIVWQAMADTDTGALHGGHDPQHAPTCRRCLARLDSQFPQPAPDQRIGLVAALVAQAVDEHGSAEVVGVPGDQLPALRRAIQRELRGRYGAPGRTWAVNDFLVVAHDATANSPAALERQHAAVANLYNEIPVVPDTDWRIHWWTWAAP